MDDAALIETLADLEAYLRYLGHLGVEELPLGAPAVISIPAAEAPRAADGRSLFRAPGAPAAGVPGGGAAGAGGAGATTGRGDNPVAGRPFGRGVQAPPESPHTTTAGAGDRFGPSSLGRFGPSIAPPRTLSPVVERPAAPIEQTEPPVVQPGPASRSVPASSGQASASVRQAEDPPPGGAESVSRPAAPVPRPPVSTPPQARAVPDDFGPEPEPEDLGQPSLLSGLVRAKPKVEGVQQAPFSGPPPVDRTGALEALRADIGDCTRCNLCSSRQTLFFGAGGAQASVMIVCDWPSPEENVGGSTFDGAAGDMLAKIVEKVLLLAPEAVYVTHVLKCRPPETRGPTVREVETCKGFLQRQIEIVRPSVIVALGRVAAQVLIGTTTPLPKLRGHWYTYRGIPVMATFEPAAVLQDPARRRPVFEDLKQVRTKLDELS